MFSPAYNIEGTIWRGHQVKQKKKKEAWICPERFIPFNDKQPDSEVRIYSENKELFTK